MNIKYNICIKLSLYVFEIEPVDKAILKTLGSNPRQLTAWNPKARRTFFSFRERRIQRVVGHAGDLIE